MANVKTNTLKGDTIKLRNEYAIVLCFLVTITVSLWLSLTFVNIQLGWVDFIFSSMTGMSSALMLNFLLTYFDHINKKSEE